MANHHASELLSTLIEFGRIFVNYTESEELLAECKKQNVQFCLGAADNYGQWVYLVG